jgi:hypothetical protein
MPIPSLRSTGGPRSEFYCSACNTKFKTQLLSPDMKAAIQKEWDEHLASVHPRHWEREEAKRAERQASRERSTKRWRMIIAFSVIGFVVTCLYVGYLWYSYPHQNLHVTNIFERLCPPSFLTLIYVDVPGTTGDHIITWIEVALLNAGLYGVIGATISSMRQLGHLKSKGILVWVACAVTLVSTGLIFALFHGYFDHGQFEIKQVQRSSTNQVAMLAERWDHEALGGLEYYVLIGSHEFTPTELRFAYYSDDVVFSAGDDCLSIRWIDARRLEVMCRDRSLDSRFINVRKRQVGDIATTYVNIQDGAAGGGE